MKKIIRLTESDLHRIVNESVTRIISEKRSLQSQKLYDILQQHGGLGDNSNSDYFLSLEKMTDEDIIAVLPPNQAESVQINDKKLLDLCDLNGVDVSSPTDIEFAKLKDGNYLLFRLRGRRRQWEIEKIRKRGHDRFVDGKNRYFPSTTRARDARNFENWYSHADFNPPRGYENRATRGLNYMRNGKDSQGNNNRKLSYDYHQLHDAFSPGTSRKDIPHDYNGYPE